MKKGWEEEAQGSRDFASALCPRGCRVGPAASLQGRSQSPRPRTSNFVSRLSFQRPPPRPTTHPPSQVENPFQRLFYSGLIISVYS